MNVPIQAATTVEEPSSSVSGEDDIDSWMPDKNLQTVVSYEVNSWYGLPLTKHNVGLLHDDDTGRFQGQFSLNYLIESNAPGSIKSIEGIQYATNLSKLTFSGNKAYSNLILKKDSDGIVDISPIKNLKNLTSLDFTSNSIKDISPIQNLINLEELSLGTNSITNFDVLTKLPKIKYLNIGYQSLVEPTKSITDQSFSIDPKSYIGTSGNETISNVKGTVTNNTADVKVENNVVKVSNAKSADTLVITYDGIVTYNGKTYTADTTITQPYTLTAIKTKNVSLTVGDKWDNSQGLVSVTNNKGNPGTIDDVDISGDTVDTSKPGVYKVTYTSKENKDISETATITVSAKSVPKHNSSDSEKSNISSISPFTITLGSEPISMYSATGVYLDTLNLSDFTNYTITKKNVIDGVTYYQLSDGNWIKANDVQKTADYLTTIQTHSNSNKNLYKLDGSLITDRGLAKATDWKVDKLSFINGTKYYRVATNEWVKADDGIEILPLRGAVQPSETAQLYTDFGKKSDRALAKNSRFVTDKQAKINGETMYRVSTNEWVMASQVTFK
ncbi:hypothetical protein FD31_GL000063 [Companilactobacillus nantensis DSM 16982]|uniref:Uncharacterized protein n=2 Tax=Companilactobacillus nantensis TaxID=305793 RepID=A0A0R1WTU7_9LACO|nr:hypothetical protein FD31_GL000063 [Companilactobacillus nantensis DSM 16982]